MKDLHWFAFPIFSVRTWLRLFQIRVVGAKLDIFLLLSLVDIIRPLFSMYVRDIDVASVSMIF
jgi:hypothetical protein